MPNYKVGDIVLVKSISGDFVPNVHVRLLKRIIVKPTKGKMIGMRMSMDWPGYSGWESEMVYQEEIDYLRNNCSIPFNAPGDQTFVYDSCIIKKPRKIKKLANVKINSSGKRTIVRKKNKK